MYVQKYTIIKNSIVAKPQHRDKKSNRGRRRSGEQRVNPFIAVMTEDDKNKILCFSFSRCFGGKKRKKNVIALLNKTY